MNKITKSTFVIMTIFVLLFTLSAQPTSAQSSSNLLFSYRVYGMGGYGCTPTSAASPVTLAISQIYDFLHFDSGPGTPGIIAGSIIGGDLKLLSGTTGSFDFDASNSSDFNEFVYHITDGVNEGFGIGSIMFDGLNNKLAGNVQGGLEFEMLTERPNGTLGLRNSDLIGHRIDFIRLVINNLTVEQFQNGPTCFVSGYKFDATWQFYGEAINAPIALADGPFLGTVGNLITMDASASSDPDGDPLTYKWDFGDGTILETTNAVVKHQYANVGTYDVFVMVSDGQFESGEFSTQATINFSGGGQRSDVDEFLLFASPGERSTSLPAGTTSFDVTIVYGPSINAGSFSVELDGTPLGGFNPIAGTTETVSIPLSLGRNTLLFTVKGTRSDGRTATERDSLTFIVP